jgi:hypothetical protein
LPAHGARTRTTFSDMARLSLPLTLLIHENLSIVMTFAFSRRPLERLKEEKFVGEWKYLGKALFDRPEARAEKACLELALFLRLLDDEEGLSEYLAKTDPDGFGRLILKNNSNRPLRMMDVANKIIHASGFRWDFATEGWPILICEPKKGQPWRRAEVEVVRVAKACGQIVS